MSIVCLFRAPLKIRFTEWTPCLKITITKQEDTGNRKEPAELKLEEFCAVCEEQIFWQTARRVYSANITEVYAWSYLYINSWCNGLMPYSIVS